MEKNNCITAVVSVYNMASYLERFMNTFLGQKYLCEIILVDDGSTDGSFEMCENYAKKYPDFIRVIHKDNGGLSSARNAGIEKAKGDYIIFPDPDDWVEPNYTNRMIELQNEYNLDMVCIGHYIDYDDEYFLGKNGHKFWILDGKAAQKALIVQPCISSFAWDKLFRLDIIQKYGLRFMDDVGTREDVDFSFRYLTYCNSVCYDPESRLYHYYQRNGATTHSGFSKKKFDAIHTYEKIIDSTDDYELIQAAREEVCNYAVDLVWMYKNSKIENADIWKKLREYINENFKIFIKSENFNLSRKIQVILAYLNPDIYVWLKKQIYKK